MATELRIPTVDALDVWTAARSRLREGHFVCRVSPCGHPRRERRNTEHAASGAIRGRSGIFDDGVTRRRMRSRSGRTGRTASRRGRSATASSPVSVERFAGALYELGVRPGEVVASPAAELVAGRCAVAGRRPARCGRGADHDHHPAPGAGADAEPDGSERLPDGGPVGGVRARARRCGRWHPGCRSCVTGWCSDRPVRRRRDRVRHVLRGHAVGEAPSRSAGRRGGGSGSRRRDPLHLGHVRASRRGCSTRRTRCTPVCADLSEMERVTPGRRVLHPACPDARDGPDRFRVVTC